MDSLTHASSLKVPPKPYSAPHHNLPHKNKVQNHGVARIKNNDATQAHPPAPPRCCLGGL